MGNSGSVHHMQSGLKELHSYYQVQDNCEGADDLSILNNKSTNFQNNRNCLERERPISNSKFSRKPPGSKHFDRLQGYDVTAKNSQVKVLPNLSENLKLRSTTNGAILQSGGTISGRREPLLLQPMSLERSKTFIPENSGMLFKDIRMCSMTRRSQTQLDIDLCKGSTHNLLNRSHYKCLSSNLDLKVANDCLNVHKNQSISNFNETVQKLSKVKIKNKKRKAPPVPPLSIKGQEISTSTDLTQKETENKQRLFKTKSEKILQSCTGEQPTNTKNNQTNVSTRSSDQGQTGNTYRSKINHQSNGAKNTGFRKEKSFDAKLISSRRKDNPDHQETTYHPKTSTIITKRKTLATTLTPRSTKPSLSIKTDFKKELEAATKCRLLAKNASTSEHKPNVTKPCVRLSEPNNDKLKPVIELPTPPVVTSKPITQSKIPQLKKTFYFGMEISRQKAIDSSQKHTINTYEHKKDKHETLSTSYKDEDPVYSLNNKFKSKINDNGIQVNVRPTLPRRQLEIPRFSPIAAWRTLSEEYRKQSLELAGSPPSSSSNFAVEAANTFLIEDRIYRTYREPCPFYPDNKSGDSGISGDDACLPAEKPIQPRNCIHTQNDCNELMAITSLDDFPMEETPMKVVGPFLTPWTPQQDLEEEDTSSDGELAIKLIESQSRTSAHVFSLSLPRENQFLIYGEKNQSGFRSLQKLKTSVSGELNGSGCECTQSSDSNLFSNLSLGNYRSDNWVLSKTGMTTTTLTNEQSISCNNPIDSNKKNTFLDLSVSIQPMSLGCLATGKHVMYLPNKPIKDLKRQSPDIYTKKQDNIDDSFIKYAKTRNKHFSFQSSVRQIEKRRLAEKLSKNAEQKEALRKSELEAMRRVEEEFQRKRAYEKASICQQLRLCTMDDDNFNRLSLDYSRNSNVFRAEPDGAVSSTSVSPILRYNEDGTYLIRRTVDNANLYGFANNEYHSNIETGNDITAMIFANS